MKRITAVLVVISVLCGFFGWCVSGANAVDESTSDTSEIILVEPSGELFESSARHKSRGIPMEVSGEEKEPPPKKPSQESKVEAQLADYPSQNDTLRVTATVVVCIVSVVVIISLVMIYIYRKDRIKEKRMKNKE